MHKLRLTAGALIALSGLAFLPMAQAQSQQSQPGAVLEPSQAARVIRRGDVQTALEKLAAARASGDLFAVHAQCQPDELSAQLGSAGSEAVLRTCALTLAQAPEAATDRSSRELLEQLSKRPAVTMVWHEDSSHRVAVPLYDVAAAANYALRRLDQIEKQSDLRARLVAGTLDRNGLIEATATPAAQASSLAVFKDAQDAALISMAPLLDELLQEGNAGVTAVAVTTALRLDLQDLLLNTMQQGAPDTLLRMLDEMLIAIDRDFAFSLLQTAALRPVVASAAVLRIGDLSAEVPAATDWLLARIADPALGPSAATALLRAPGEQNVPRIGSWLRAQPEPALQRRAATALRLAGTAAARSELQRSAADSAVDVNLRKDIEQWLQP